MPLIFIPGRPCPLIEDIIKLSRMDGGDINQNLQKELSSCVSVINTLSDKHNPNIKIDYRGDTSLVYGIKPIL